MGELKENIVATIIENEELTDAQKIECLKRLNNLRERFQTILKKHN